MEYHSNINYRACNVGGAWNKSGRDTTAWLAGINLWLNVSTDYTSIPGYVTGYDSPSLNSSGRATSIDRSSWTYYPAIVKYNATNTSKAFPTGGINYTVCNCGSYGYNVTSASWGPTGPYVRYSSDIYDNTEYPFFTCIPGFDDSSFMVSNPLPLTDGHMTNKDAYNNSVPFMTACNTSRTGYTKVGGTYYGMTTSTKHYYPAISIYRIE